MKSLTHKTVVAAGGTGNVGSFLVKELLKRGATVAVPSRSKDKIEGLISHLSGQLEDKQLDHIKPFTGNIGTEEGAEKLFNDISGQIGLPDAVIASLGHFIPAPSLLEAKSDELQKAVDHYLMSHFAVAKTFLKRLKKHNGTYIFINGPLALEPWEDSGTGLISIATAGQHMLFKALARELKERPVRISELVTYAFLRDRQTQPGSPIPGEAVGAFASHLVSDSSKEIDGKQFRLQSLEPLEKAGVEIDL